MEPAIRLTAATLDDAQDMGRLQVFVHEAHVANVVSYFRPVSAEYLGKVMAEKLREADTRGFVARCEDEAVGYILGCVKRRPEREVSFAYNSLYIDQIFVTSERREQGVARALVEAMRTVAQSEGLSALDLDVWSFNVEARRVFAALGFGPQIERMCMPLQRTC